MFTAVSGATKHSLVIVDEFGASTYENDGAALLTGCLDHWGAMARGTRDQTADKEVQEQEESRGKRSGMDHSASMDENDSEISTQPETDEDSIHSKREDLRSKREGKRRHPHVNSNKRDERETLDIESEDTLVPENEEESTIQQDNNRPERRNIHDQRDTQGRSSSGSRRRRKEETQAAGGAPHVFVSTHLLQVFDHLQYPDTVRCLVSDVQYGAHSESNTSGTSIYTVESLTFILSY